MRGLTLPLLVATLAAPITSQVSVTLTSLGGSARASISSNSFPAGPVPAAGYQTGASHSSVSCFGTCVASCSYLASGGRVAVDAMSANYGVYFCAVGTTATAGLVVAFSAPSPTAGLITLVADGSTAGAFSGATITIDIGNDNSIDLTPGAGRTVVQIPCVVGPRAVSIASSLGANAGTFGAFPQMASAAGAVDVTFTPGSSTFATSGLPCGPVLGAYTYVLGTSRTVTLLVDGSILPALAFFGLGTTPLSFSIPPTGCLLGVDPLLTVPATVQPNGSVTLVFTVPSAVGGAMLLQYMTISQQMTPPAILFHASNVLAVTLP